jgi:hypothetical protein
MPPPSSRLPTLWLRSIRLRSMAAAAALAIFAIAASLTGRAAEARDEATCEQFNWSVKRELEWFRDPYLEMVFSGATLGSVPDKGLVLELQPQGTVDHVLAPGGELKSDTFAGVFLVKTVPKAGTFQVTASQDAWIDLIQDGKALDLSAETLNPNCSDAPKSMRFHLEPGPLTVQISGASSNRIKLAISPVE